MSESDFRILIGDLEVSYSSVEAHITDRKFWNSLLQLLDASDVSWTCRRAICTVVDESLVRMHGVCPAAVEAGIETICAAFKGQYLDLVDTAATELPLSDASLSRLAMHSGIQEVLSLRREPRWLLIELATIELKEGRGRLERAIWSLGAALFSSSDASDEEFHDFTTKFGAARRVMRDLREFVEPSSEMKAVYLARVCEQDP